MHSNVKIIYTDTCVTVTDKSTKALVGMAELTADSYISLAIYSKEVDTTLRGTEVFKELIDFYIAKNINFLGIEGNWSGPSDNLQEFNALLSNKRVTTQEEAAINTWTGRRAKDIGFSQVKIKKTTPPTGPPFIKISALFLKHS
jgi:hypothetical protein